MPIDRRIGCSLESIGNYHNFSMRGNINVELEGENTLQEVVFISGIKT
jgi:hypothetical protein